MKKIRNRKDLQITDLLIAHGPAGYGVYVMLTQYLTERKALRSRRDIARIAYELHAPAEMVRSVLEDFGLFVCIDDEFFTESSPAKKPDQSAKSTESKESERSEESEKSENLELSEKPKCGNSTAPANNSGSHNKPKSSVTRKIPVKKLLKRSRPTGKHTSPSRGNESQVTARREGNKGS